MQCVSTMGYTPPLVQVFESALKGTSPSCNWAFPVCVLEEQRNIFSERKSHTTIDLPRLALTQFLRPLLPILPVRIYFGGRFWDIYLPPYTAGDTYVCTSVVTALAKQAIESRRNNLHPSPTRSRLLRNTNRKAKE